ncbi:MAG: hypothetical protein A2W22_01410 [Candidatus Levybacteria bacterium RBG_16_35_11]|nr:MAG: hypothetical protein A2W22_01410 [Candidatus Levybacteria bacterium RBG_16_35_11]
MRRKRRGLGINLIIIGAVIFLGYIMVGGFAPSFTLTPANKGVEYEIITPGPAGQKSSLQLETIKFKECGKTVAVDLVLDRSGSMSERQDGGSKQKIQYLKDATKTFVSLMPDDSPLGMQSFGSDASLDFKIDKLGGRRDLVNSKINSLRPSGSTNMNEGLKYARDELKEAIPKFSNYSFSLILLSDGQWNTGGDPTSIANEIKEMKVKIFTISFGDNTGAAFMKKAASDLSYWFYSPGNQELENVFKQIAVRLCNENK